MSEGTGRKFFRFNLENTEDRLKLLILISGSIILLSALTVGGVLFTMRSSFCSSCHVMLPEYRTWEVSSHRGTACVDCHIEPGLGNLIKDKIGAMVQVFKHVTRTYPSPIEFPWQSKDIPNETCLKCHPARETYTPTGDIIVPHGKHLERGVKCVDCHIGVVHGRIAERGVSKESKRAFKEWNEEFALQQIAPEYSRPKMNACIKCHNGGE